MGNKAIVFLAMCFAFSIPSSHTVFKNHLIFRARRNLRYHQSLWFSNILEPKGEFFKSYQKPIWKTDKKRWSSSTWAMSQKSQTHTHTHTYTHDFPTVAPNLPLRIPKCSEAVGPNTVKHPCCPLSSACLWGWAPEVKANRPDFSLPPLRVRPCSLHSPNSSIL